jgi:hypothetical protein
MPIILRDSNGSVIAGAIPPPSDTVQVVAMLEELRSLETKGSVERKLKRGPFKTVNYGIQMGHGSKVSCCALF